MKIKAITYKSDGNTLTSKFYDVTEIAKGVCISKDADSNLYCLIFGNVEKDVWVTDGLYHLQTIQANIDYLSTIPVDYIKFALGKEYIRNSDIEFVKQCGLDAQILIKRREEILRLRKEEEAEKQAKKQQEFEIEEKERFNRIDTCLSKLKNGEQITFGDLIEIIERYNIKIAPRTLGAIRNQKSSFFIEKGRAVFNKNTARTTVNSIFNVIRQVIELNP